MQGLRSLRGGAIVAMLTTACFFNGASAEVLDNLAVDDVDTTYAYPAGQTPGSLSLNDTGVGVIATFLDAPQVGLDNIGLTLSMSYMGEVGNAGDTFAHGMFGDGTITLVDMSPDSSGLIVFQADVTGFELMEVIPGGYAGEGTFTNAVYGGALAGVTAPTAGDLVTSLFTWHTGSFNGPVVDISNFLNAPIGGSTIYSTMHDLTLTPEPGTLGLLAIAGLAIRRRRTNA